MSNHHWTLLKSPLAATTITPSSNKSGARQFILANGLGNSNSAEIWITDPTPEITTVTPDRPWTAG